MNSDLQSRIGCLVAQMEGALSRDAEEFEERVEEWRNAVASIFGEIGDKRMQDDVMHAHIIDSVGIGFGRSFVDGAYWNKEVVMDILRRLKAVVSDA